jgi:hypothetical protein
MSCSKLAMVVPPKLIFLKKPLNFILFCQSNFIVIMSCICVLKLGKTFSGIIFVRYDSCNNIFNFLLISTSYYHVAYYVYNLMPDVTFGCVKCG